MGGDCPAYPNGQHRYFVSKTYEMHNSVDDITDENGLVYTGLYERTEYAIVSCNCGNVMRQTVKDRL